MEQIIYYQRTPDQVKAFLEAYATLCRTHKIYLAADESYRICPVVDGLCSTQPEYTEILRSLEGVDIEARRLVQWPPG